MKILFSDKIDEGDGDVDELICDIVDRREAMTTTINIPKSFQYCKFLKCYEQA